MRGTETNTVSCICILSFMSTGETIHWTESTNLTLLWGSRQRCVCVCWVGADSTNLKICLMWHSAYLEMFYIFFFHIHGIYYDVTVMSSHQSTMSCYMRFTHTHTPNQLKPQILLYYYYKYYMLHVMMLHTHHTHIPITQVNSRTMRNRIREREREHRWIHMRWLIPK